VVRHFAFHVAAVLLGIPEPAPTSGARAAFRGVLWQLQQLVIGVLAVSAACWAIPLSLAALMVALGVEPALPMAGIEVGRLAAALWVVAFIALVACAPLILRGIGRWIRFSSSWLLGGNNPTTEHPDNEALGTPALTFRFESLSAREIEILALLVQGCTNREIATSLFVTPETVKSHVSRILAKLHADNRTQAVSIALQNDLVAPAVLAALPR
jgi:DNA-binding NarL/FixJ family response regulator